MESHGIFRLAFPYFKMFSYFSQKFQRLSADRKWRSKKETASSRLIKSNIYISVLPTNEWEKEDLRAETEYLLRVRNFS